MGNFDTSFAESQFPRAARLFNAQTGEAKPVPAWRRAVRDAASAAGAFVTRSKYAGAVLFLSFAPPVVRAEPVPVVAEPPSAPVYMTRFQDPAFVPAARVEIMVAVPAPAVAAVQPFAVEVSAPAKAEFVKPVAPDVQKAQVGEAPKPVVEEVKAPVVETAPKAPEVAAVAEQPVKRATLKLSALAATPAPAPAPAPEPEPVPALSKSFPSARAVAAEAQISASAPAQRPVLKLKHAVAAAATNDAGAAPVNVSAAPVRSKLSLSSPVKIDAAAAAVNLTRRSSTDDFAAAFKAELMLAEARGDITTPVREKSRAADQKLWNELTTAFREGVQEVTGQKPAAPQQQQAVQPKTAINQQSKTAFDRQPKAAANPKSKNAFNLTSAGVPSAAQKIPAPAQRRAGLAA